MFELLVCFYEIANYQGEGDIIESLAICIWDFFLSVYNGNEVTTKP